MMMKPPPAAAFEVVQPELILEFLIVAFNPPAQLGEADELGDRDRRGQGREPVLRGRVFAPGPFDQQPLVGSGRRAPLVTMSGPHAEAREARAQRPARALAPG